jgi:type VI secretion system protein ImpK
VAHYALCAAVDEAVLSTPWGAHSEWAQETLLVRFYGEVVGGQRFFDMLKRVQEEPERFIDLLEVMAVCLALGFGGEYGVATRGGDRLSDLHRDLVGLIRRERGPSPTELSPHWRGVQNRKNPVIRYVPWWVVAVAGLALLSLIYLFLFTRLGPPVTRVSAAINRAADTAPPPARSAPLGPRLKELIDQQPGLRDMVRVEEDGARTTVTLPDLFASGKDTPQPRFDPLLETLKQVLRQVPGRITVIGHTDDQPPRKFLYTTNDALSLARATRVLEVVSTADNRHQFAPVGSGQEQPICRAPTPECRAQNRRVEIRHDP